MEPCKFGLHRQITVNWICLQESILESRSKPSLHNVVTCSMHGVFDANDMTVVAYSRGNFDVIFNQLALP